MGADGAGDRDRGAVARQPANRNLRVGGLCIELAGDGQPQAFGGLARRFDPAGIGDVDIALTVDLNLFEGRNALTGIAEKRVILDVFKDRQAQNIPRSNRVRSNHPGIQESRGEAQGGDNRRCSGHRRIDCDDKGVAVFEHRTLVNFRLVGPRARQAASRDACAERK